MVTLCPKARHNSTHCEKFFKKREKRTHTQRHSEPRGHKKQHLGREQGMTNSEGQTLQTSSGEDGQIKEQGNSALPFPQDGKEKAEPKVTPSLSPVITVGTLRGGS